MHCEPNPDGEVRRQSKSCMQSEAIAESVRTLREHEQSDSGGLPVGQARRKIILPCGTGKTRISLRIVEELTPTGEVSIVLCPSIALVAQIRREYLQNAERPIRALAVCSGETAGYDPQKEGSRNTAEDPTVDKSKVQTPGVPDEITRLDATEDTTGEVVLSWRVQSGGPEATGYRVYRKRLTQGGDYGQGDWSTGTYRIKVRVNNACVMDGGRAFYPWFGGPDGYVLDTPADDSTKRKIETSEAKAGDFLGDSWDWYWDGVPDVDWTETTLIQGQMYRFEAWASEQFPPKDRR